MESTLSSNTAPSEITDCSEIQKLVELFDIYFYGLSAFSDIHKLPMSPQKDTPAASFLQQSSILFNMSSFQLPKRKFPSFSGVNTEWQSFEDLFKSILSHAPNLPDVERFEYFKTSLEGESLSLISHFSITATNYHSAWDILKARYGNKHDLARIHLDALLAKQSVKSKDASSIKNQINIILEHTAALDNLDLITCQ